MANTVSTRQLGKQSSAIVAELKRSGEPLLLTHMDDPVAVIVPLGHIERHLPQLLPLLEERKRRPLTRGTAH